MHFIFFFSLHNQVSFFLCTVKKKKYRKSTSFSLFQRDPVSARLLKTCALGFSPSSWVSLTRTLLGPSTSTITLARGQAIQGVCGFALIIFVLNIHESWLSRVFLIDYKSNGELEK